MHADGPGLVGSTGWAEAKFIVKFSTKGLPELRAEAKHRYCYLCVTVPLLPLGKTLDVRADDAGFSNY